jgi:signal transduction histidine kinase
MAQPTERFLSTPTGKALVVAGLALLLLLAAWRQAVGWYETQLLTEQRAEIVGEILVRGNALSSAVNRRLARLQGLHSFVETVGNEPEFAISFEKFAAGLYAGSRGVRNLALAPDGAVQYVYPLAGNESVIGYRPGLDSRLEVRRDVERAIATGEVVLSDPVELLQGGLGLIARQTAYVDGVYWGLVNIVLDLPPLLSEAGVDNPSGPLQFALRDSSSRIFYGNPDLFEESPVIVNVDLSEGYWELAGAPVTDWGEAIQEPLFVFKAAGIVIVLLLVLLVYLVTNRQSRLSLAVGQRTRELTAANELLERRVAERTHELSTLLDISRSITFTLELAPLLNQVLYKLLAVIDYTGAAILTLGEGSFVIRAYQGPFTRETILQHAYVFDNVIGHALLHDRQPVIIPDVYADTEVAQAFRLSIQLEPRSANKIRSWLGVPLIARDRVIGILALHHKVPDFYQPYDASLALAFANQVAVAIDNARLYEQAQELAILQERQRLARELHDSVSQALYGIALGARTANKILEQGPDLGNLNGHLKESIDYVLDQANAGLTEMRALIFELRPESLETEGLVCALERQTAAIQTRYHIPVEASFCDEPGIPLRLKEAFYRVAQEALNNIVKHAGASQITIRLSCDADWLYLEIGDDGSGFDPNGNFSGHLGLTSMRERIEQFSGSFTITSAPGQGTLVQAAAPLA